MGGPAPPAFILCHRGKCKNHPHKFSSAVDGVQQKHWQSPFFLLCKIQFLTEGRIPVLMLIWQKSSLQPCTIVFIQQVCMLLALIHVRVDSLVDPHQLYIVRP